MLRLRGNPLGLPRGVISRIMSSQNGDKYRFETYNNPFTHETKVFRNGEFVIVFPIGFCHNYNYTRFCEWVMEVFF